MKTSVDRMIENRRRRYLAFTLMEVMIAMAIFFTAVFAILAVVGQSLRSARMLSQNAPTPGMALNASQLSITNKLEEGSWSGDFGDVYPDYEWSAETIFYASNGLYQVDVAVLRNGKVDSFMSVLRYAPESTTGNRTRSVFQ